MRPLLPLLIAFSAGVASSRFFGANYPLLFAFISASSILILSFYLLGLRFRAVAVAPVFFFLGALFMTPYLKPEIPQWHIKNFIRDEIKEDEGGKPGKALFRGYTDAAGTVAENPEYRGERTRLVVKANKILSGGEWRGTEGLILLSVEGRVEWVRRGDTVRFLAKLKETSNFGNPGGFDYKWHLSFKGIYVTGYVKDKRFVVKTGDGGGGEGGGGGVGWGMRLSRSVDGVRASINNLIDSTGAEFRGPLKALITGERGEIDKGLNEAFVKTGTSHILSISGLHVGMVAFSVYFLVFFIIRRSERLLLALNARKAAAILTLVPVLFYGLISGFQVSTERAVIMAALFTITVFLDRGRDYYNVVSLAALAILIAKPYALWDVSFQLTFAAVFSLLFFTPRLKDLLKAGGGEEGEEEKKGGAGGGGGGMARRLAGRLKQWAVLAIITTVSATIGVSPILAFHFNRVSLTGVLANIVAVPLTNLIVPLLLAASALLPLSYTLSQYLVNVSDLLFNAMAFFVEAFARLPYSSVLVAKPTPLEIALFYGLAVSVVSIRKAVGYRLMVPAIMALYALDLGYWSLSPSLDRDLKVTFVSVGQGDSALVEFPGGKTMLIDGGGFYGTDFDSGKDVLAPFLLYKKIKTIDYMVLSHAQRDHMEGFRYIVRNFRVREFWWNGMGGGAFRPGSRTGLAGGGDAGLKGLMEALKDKGVVVKTVDSSSDMKDINGVRAEIVYPDSGVKKGLPLNDTSVVMRLSYGGRSFLFTGDIGSVPEKEISGRDVRADVLKAPHHGSRNSSSAVFLSKVRPSLVVVSAGRGNSFGFPHEETLKRYKEAGIRVLRTDLQGAVTIETDGEGMRESVYLTGFTP